MLRAKRGFAQSRDCPAQTLHGSMVCGTNRGLAAQSCMHGIARVQSMDQENPGIALRKA